MAEELEHEKLKSGFWLYSEALRSQQLNNFQIKLDKGDWIPSSLRMTACIRFIELNKLWTLKWNMLILELF